MSRVSVGAFPPSDNAGETAAPPGIAAHASLFRIVDHVSPERHRRGVRHSSALCITQAGAPPCRGGHNNGRREPRTQGGTRTHEEEP